MAKYYFRDEPEYSSNLRLWHHINLYMSNGNKKCKVHFRNSCMWVVFGICLQFMHSPLSNGEKRLNQAHIA